VGCFHSNDCSFKISLTLTAVLPLLLRPPSSHLLCLDTHETFATLSRPKSPFSGPPRNTASSSPCTHYHSFVLAPTQETLAAPSRPKRPSFGLQSPDQGKQSFQGTLLLRHVAADSLTGHAITFFVPASVPLRATPF
jgi:hypothetical protein